MVAIASIGLTGPGAHADDLFAEAGCGLVDLLHRDQAVIGFVGEATFELVKAHIIGPPFDQGKGRSAAQYPGQGLREDGEVTVDDLTLQSQGGGGDHGRGTARPGMRDGRDQISQGLARAGARLNEQVGALVDRALHGIRHLPLPLAWHAADAADGSVEEGVERRGGHRTSLCRGRGGPASCRNLAVGARCKGPEPEGSGIRRESWGQGGVASEATGCTICTRRADNSYAVVPL